MTQDEIIRMARKVGTPETEIEGVFMANLDDLGRFAALVAEPWIETNKALAKEIIGMKKRLEEKNK